MSGYSEAVLNRSAAQLGVDGLLATPFTRETLGKAVQETLSSGAASHA